MRIIGCEKRPKGAEVREMVEPGARRSTPKDPRGDRLEARMLGRLAGAR